MANELHEKHFQWPDSLKISWLTLTANNNVPIPVALKTWVDVEL